MAYWYLTSTSYSTTYSLPSYSYTASWRTVVLYSSQSTGLFTMYLAGYTTSASGFEFRGQISSTVCYFGGQVAGGAFTGFIREMYADNLVTTTYKLMTPYITCEYNEYFSPITTSCTACTGCSSTWPWCARSSCSVCYSTLCSACTGFGYSYCTACTNTKTAPNCATGVQCTAGTVFACTSCSGTYTNIDGHCLVAPYAYNSATLSTPVIAITFNTFAQLYGGIFQSGSNSGTWGPFNSPATDDPIPVNSRGLYFDGVARYLVSTSNIVMNYQSSVAMWIYPQNSYMAMCTVAFYYFAIGFGGITLTNPDGAWYQYTYNTEVLYNQWVFGAYTISFASDTTTVTYTTATAVTSVLSVNGYAFHDSGSLMWIGKYSTYAYFYEGFIYSFTLWQTAITILPAPMIPVAQASATPV